MISKILVKFNFLNKLNEKNSNALSATISQGLSSVVNFIMSLVILHDSGLLEFGAFTVSVILLWMIRNLAIGTFFSSISAVGPKIKKISNSVYRGFLLSYLILFLMISSITLSTVQVFTIIFQIDLIRQDLFQLTLVANIVIIGTEFYRRYNITNQEPGKALTLDIVRYTAQLTSLALYASSASLRIDGVQALWILIGSNLLSLSIGSVRYGRVGWRKTFAAAVWPKHKLFLRWMLPANILEILQFNVPLLMAADFVGYQAVALLRAIQQLSNIINLPANAFQQFLQSSYARLIALGDTFGVNALSRYSFAVLLTFIATISAVVVIFAKPIANIMSFEFNPLFFNILLLFLILNLFISIRSIYYSLAIALEIPNAIFLAAMYSCVNAGISVLLFLGIFGIYAIPLIEIVNTIIGIMLIRAMVKRNISRKFPSKHEQGSYAKPN